MLREVPAPPGAEGVPIFGELARQVLSAHGLGRIYVYRDQYV